MIIIHAKLFLLINLKYPDSKFHKYKKIMKVLIVSNGNNSGQAFITALYMQGVSKQWMKWFDVVLGVLYAAQCTGSNTEHWTPVGQAGHYWCNYTRPRGIAFDIWQEQKDGLGNTGLCWRAVHMYSMPPGSERAHHCTPQRLTSDSVRLLEE